MATISNYPDRIAALRRALFDAYAVVPTRDDRQRISDAIDADEEAAEAAAGAQGQNPQPHAWEIRGTF